MTTFPLLGQSLRQLFGFYQDREYLSKLFKIAWPIAAQNLIISVLNLVGVMMIGQLGEIPVAAVGLANQMFFLLQLFLFGITSGSAIFTAQLWGKRDIPNIRKVLGLSVFLGLLSGLAFLAIAELIPQAILGIYSQDPSVIAVGSEYLRLFGWSYLFVTVTLSYSAVLRSIGDVKKPLVISTAALGFNTLLSYGLIFGYFGLPKMGVQGVALAGIIARVLECGALLWLTYYRPSPAAASLREMLSFDFHFASKILKPVLPVTLNELLWALGITAYNIIYAHIGTDAIAAMNIAGSIDGLALVVFFAISNACAILVGNHIGAEEEERAYRYAGRSLGLGILCAVIVGILIMAGTDVALSIYKVSPSVTQYAKNILTIIACFLWARGINMVIFIGILRSGGDTTFGFVLDVGAIWVVGVPLALLGAFVFDLPVHWVYLLVMGDELTKWSIGIWRYFSKKWIHNLAQTV